MRIIAGKFSGRQILSPDSQKTRPITDRAKQSLFDALQNCFENATVLDCFSGTGSIGLECLSRGAAKAIFIEQDRSALKLLRQNIDDLNLKPQSLILPIDAYALASSSTSTSTSSPSSSFPSSSSGHPDLQNLTVAFIDPPYSHTETGHLRHKVDHLIAYLAGHAMVDGGIISLRHPARVSVDPASLGVVLVREFQYGDMAITWLRRAARSEPRA